MISDRGIWANLFHWDASLTTGAPLAPLAVDAVLRRDGHRNDVLNVWMTLLADFPAAFLVAYYDNIMIIS